MSEERAPLEAAELHAFPGFSIVPNEPDTKLMNAMHAVINKTLGHLPWDRRLLFHLREQIVKGIHAEIIQHARARLAERQGE